MTNRIILISIAVLAAISVCSIAWAQQASGAGQMVYIDPETGEISKNPSPEQQLELKEKSQILIDNSNNEMNFIQMADGSIKIELNGRFQKTVNAVIGQNGELETGHHLHMTEEASVEEEQ